MLAGRWMCLWMWRGIEVRRMEQLLHFPAAAGAVRYRLTVLGPFSLARNGLPLETGGWRPRALTLLRLLAVAPGFRRMREEVIDLL
jgi:hypothetical protein